jgi:hypothetical protein
MTTLNSANTSLVSSLCLYECGELSDEETIDFFQELIDSGSAWRMSGHYGRKAMQMIRAGRCMLGTTGYHDAYGNYVPSRDEVTPGTPGSAEFVLQQIS